MAINPKAFGPTDTPAVPQTRPAVGQTGFGRLTSRAPELGGDVEAVRALRQLPTFRHEPTETGEPEPFRVDADTLDFGEADALAPPTPATGMARLTTPRRATTPTPEGEEPSDIAQAFGTTRKTISSGGKAIQFADQMRSGFGQMTSTPADVSRELARVGFDVPEARITELMGSGQLSPLRPDSYGDIGGATGDVPAAGSSDLNRTLPFVTAALAGAEAGANSRNAGEGAARAGLTALGAYGASALGPVGGAFFGEGIGRTVQAWMDLLGLSPEMSHAQRESLETGEATGRAQNMVEEVLGSDSRDALWRTLERYKGPGAAGRDAAPILHGVRSVDDLFADPSAYAANIQAGVTPEGLTDPNGRLTDAVRRQVALIQASEAGDPRATQMLVRQREAHRALLNQVRGFLHEAGGEHPDAVASPEILDRILGGRFGLARGIEEFSGLPDIAPGLVEHDLLGSSPRDVTATIRALAGTQAQSGEGTGGGYATPPAGVVGRAREAMARGLEALATTGPRALFDDGGTEGSSVGFHGLSPEDYAVAQALYRARTPFMDGGG